MSPGGGDGPAPKVRKGYENYLRYSGLGFQMALTILAGTLGGRWLDGRTGWRFPVFMLVGALGGIAAAMVLLFKETRRP